MSATADDEGGFAPNFGSNDECLSTILQAIEKTGYRAVRLASDHADLVVDAALNVYDVMALGPVIQGAGDIVTLWSGGLFANTFRGDILAAATPQLHARPVRILGNS